MARIFYEETIEDFWGRDDYVILDENNHEADYNDFHDGDILILEDMPYDYRDASGEWHHATGRAIWGEHGWKNEYRTSTRTNNIV